MGHAADTGRFIPIVSKLRLVIYDINPTNPYGRELSAILRAEVVRPTYLGSVETKWLDEDSRNRRVLSGGRARFGAALTGIWRLADPLIAVTSAAMVRGVLIVIWTRGPWECAVLWVAARLGLKIIVVDHNPLPSRRAGGLRGIIERQMLRAVLAVVVHSDRLISDGRGIVSKLYSICHPPYLEWASRFALPRSPSNGDPLAVLFLGALRADKGVGELGEVMGHLAAVPSELLIAGRGTLSDDTLESLVKSNIKVRRFGDPLGASDGELAQALLEADLLAAPYVHATQSGSVILALSCGVPVVGYRSGALSDVVVERSLVDVADRLGLAERIEAFVAAPWECAVHSPEELRAQTAMGWGRLLQEVAPKRALPTRSVGAAS